MERGLGPCEVGALTHEAGDEHSSDPLLPHLLDLGLVAGCDGSAHNRQGVHVSDRADSGGREPGQPKQPAEPTQGANQQQVQVEAGALEQPPGLLADDEPAGREAGLSGGEGRRAAGPGMRSGEGPARTEEPSPGSASFLCQVPKVMFSRQSKFGLKPHTVDI